MMVFMRRTDGVAVLLSSDVITAIPMLLANLADVLFAGN